MKKLLNIYTVPIAVAFTLLTCLAISPIYNAKVDTSQFVATSALDTDVNLAANSDTKIATQKAAKAYIDSINSSLVGTISALQANGTTYSFYGGDGGGGADNYQMTNSDSQISLVSSGDVLVNLAAPGTYLIFGRAYLAYANATYASTQTVTIHLRRANESPADIPDAITKASMRVITTITDSIGVMPLPPIVYTTANSDDQIALYGSLSAAPAAGSVKCFEASIVAIKIQ